MKSASFLPNVLLWDLPLFLVSYPLQDRIVDFLEGLSDADLKKESKNEARTDTFSVIIKVTFFPCFVSLVDSLPRVTHQVDIPQLISLLCIVVNPICGPVLCLCPCCSMTTKVFCFPWFLKFSVLYMSPYFLGLLVSYLYQACRNLCLRCPAREGMPQRLEEVCLELYLRYVELAICIFWHYIRFQCQVFVNLQVGGPISQQPLLILSFHLFHPLLHLYHACRLLQTSSFNGKMNAINEVSLGVCCATLEFAFLLKSFQLHRMLLLTLSLVLRLLIASCNQDLLKGALCNQLIPAQRMSCVDLSDAANTVKTWV